MTVALVQYLTVKDALGEVLNQWQNYWVGQVVNGHEFAPFRVPSLISQVSSGTESVAIEIPVSASNVEIVEIGLQSYYVATVEQYQFVPIGNGIPQAMQKVAAFTGEFESAQITDFSIALAIGLNLDSTESQVPIRTFTTTLAGSPPKL